MNRRHLIRTATGLTLTSTFLTTRTRAANSHDPASPCAGTPTPGDSPDPAGAWFRWAGDDGIRSVFVRAQQWPGTGHATRARHDLLAIAGPDLPEGEFYGTDPVTFDTPDLGKGHAVNLVGWTTTVGVAAFHTGYALLTVQRAAFLWDTFVSAAELDLATDLATELMLTHFAQTPPCAPLDDYIPTVDDLPAGATEEPWSPSNDSPR